MGPWINPDESKREAWTGTTERATATRTVYERAHETATPYERREEVVVSGPDVAAEFRTARYDNAKLHYHIVVDGQCRVRLLTKGHLWGHEESHRRFRVQYRREAEPTEVPPFEEYSAWTRFQTGTVTREDGSLVFEPDPDATEERTLTLSWPEMYSSDQLRVAEAELVRNPPLARYALVQQGLWDEVRDALRYNPGAFGKGP